MLFHLSRRAWGVSMPSSNTTRYWFSSNRATIPLIHSPQECKDVEEKLGDLIPWLIKLKDSLTTPKADNNPEEAERRENLTRFVSHLYRRTVLSPTIIHPRSLEEIEKRSRVLSEKGKVAKILDKKRDSGTIVKLVEELRQAILIYQVGTVGCCNKVGLTPFLNSCPNNGL